MGNTHGHIIVLFQNDWEILKLTQISRPLQHSVRFYDKPFCQIVKRPPKATNHQILHKIAFKARLRVISSRVTHIFVYKLTIIGLYKGLSHGRRQVIIWASAGVSFTGSWVTNFSDFLWEFKYFQWRKYLWKCRLRTGFHFVSASICWNSPEIQPRLYVSDTFIPWLFGNAEHQCTINPPGKNGCHFADDIFTCIFLNDRFCILIKMPLKVAPKDIIDNKAALGHVYDAPMSQLSSRCEF